VDASAPALSTARTASTASTVAAVAFAIRQATAGDSTLSERVGAAVTREAHRAGFSPALVVGILVLENDRLAPRARNRSSGATGLMQVMPLHVGRWACGSRDLTHPDTNICYGVRVLSEQIRMRRGDLHRALLGYNGCVRGTVTRGCHRYPDRVLRQAAVAEDRMAAYRARDGSHADMGRSPAGGEWPGDTGTR
jgi:soluble lytic murein transglycosylase-like protein